MRVSVHIATSSRPGELSMCLSSLYNQTFEGWDLVLVDYSKPDIITHKYIADMLSRFKIDGHATRYVRNPVWGNVGQARNLCITNDDLNDVFVRVDDDSLMDKNYLSRLVSAYGLLCEQYKTKKVAVGGVVPTLGTTNYYAKAPVIFNEIRYDKEGNMVVMKDDGGMSYVEDAVLKSHHLRSSFLFPRDSPLFPVEYGCTGFREESDWSIQFAYAGGLLFTDVKAVCFHQRSTGNRIPPEQYNQNVKLNSAHFARKFKRMFEQKGVPKWFE